MNADTPNVDRKDLAERLRTRGLIGTLADRQCRRIDDDHPELLEAVATILNSAGAPPIDLGADEALNELGGPGFFLVQHVLCDLIPLLNVDQSTLLPFVARLLEAGGNDLAANAPSEAFGEWTKKDVARPAALYAAARDGDEPARRQLGTVLRMNTDVDEALAFARADDREPKLAAIFALGAMDVGERHAEVLAELLRGAASANEDIALRSLEAAYRASERRKAHASAEFDAQLDRVLQGRSPHAVHLASNLLWLHKAGLSENAIALCLNAAAYVDPDNTGTIANIDHATYQLVGNEDVERVVRLLADLMDRSEGRITLAAFQSTYHALKTAGPDVLGGAVAYWLLEGGVHTRKCVAGEVCSVGNDDPPFAIEPAALPADPSDQLFLCRKAVGWFFIDPLAAVAIPLAVLRHGSPTIADKVLDLIYDPLLLSYGGKLRDYLERYIADGGPNADSLGKLLAQKTELQDAMEGIERLVELHPTETQREAERVQWHDQMERGMEQGRRRSFLDDLFTKQYILYGRSSLTPIHVGEGETRLSETEMKSFSVSSELPLLNIVDPVGLDRTLMHLKLERRAQP